MAVLPPPFVLDPLLQSWLLEDIGRGDRTTQSLITTHTVPGKAKWLTKETGIIAGLAIAARIFQLANPQIELSPTVTEGQACDRLQVIAEIQGPLDGLLIGERTALNLVMRLSGIATATRQYVEKIADLPTRFVDTRKTTPGLRILEKYASQVGGALNHRMGLDDAAMIKDNHIIAAGGIGAAIAQVRAHLPYPLTIEVETATLAQVEEALTAEADIIMLDNMPLQLMQQAVQLIRQSQKRVKVEASGNITLETIRPVAQTGVDYISSSAPITLSSWLDLSMRLEPKG